MEWLILFEEGNVGRVVFVGETVVEEQCFLKCLGWLYL